MLVRNVETQTFLSERDLNPPTSIVMLEFFLILQSDEYGMAEPAVLVTN